MIGADIRQACRNFHIVASAHFHVDEKNFKGQQDFMFDDNRKDFMFQRKKIKRIFFLSYDSS